MGRERAVGGEEWRTAERKGWVALWRGIRFCMMRREMLRRGLSEIGSSFVKWMESYVFESNADQESDSMTSAPE